MFGSDDWQSWFDSEEARYLEPWEYSSTQSVGLKRLGEEN